MSLFETTQTTPRSLGYSMPAEWAPHRATWLSWPHNQETWPIYLEKVRQIWLQMVCALAPYEHVNLLVNDDPTERDVAARLKQSHAAMENVTLLKIPTIDVWMRDYGPTFVTRHSTESPLAFNDWVFNGWGGKYPDYERDERVAREIAALLKVPVFDHEIVLEGGSIEVNGAGLLLTTEQCLLNENRNPQLSRPRSRSFLKFFGSESRLWLGKASSATIPTAISTTRALCRSTTVVASLSPSKDDNYGFFWTISSD